ncbi:hypothetical protein, partial [Fictibacillus sp. NRS-1165]|uniref:hypothetical protein n=1 Tax=Fictibacillus sp. NRS-1165 TaxID=3144463 RepID=UPI003D200981
TFRGHFMAGAFFVRRERVRYPPVTGTFLFKNSVIDKTSNTASEAYLVLFIFMEKVTARKDKTI